MEREWKLERTQATWEEHGVSVMNGVYTWMCGALLLTAAIAFGVASSPVALHFLLGNAWAMWVAIIAQLVLVFTLSARIDKLEYSTALVLFLAYAALNGLTMSSIFLLYTATSVARVFLITAAAFGGMSLVGYFTKKNLGAFGSFFLVALIGLVIASVVNMFLHSSQLDWILSIVGVLLFAGLTAYDTQRIKDMMLSLQGEEDAVVKKAALMGALSLYLDFINLFLYLLRLFGRRE